MQSTLKNESLAQLACIVSGFVLFYLMASPLMFHGSATGHQITTKPAGMQATAQHINLMITLGS